MSKRISQIIKEELRVAYIKLKSYSYCDITELFKDENL